MSQADLDGMYQNKFSLNSIPIGRVLRTGSMEIMNGGDQITATMSGAIMEVNITTKSVQVYGSHPTVSVTKGFNVILRDLGIAKRIVYRASSDNCLRVIPLEEMIR